MVNHDCIIMGGLYKGGIWMIRLRTVSETKHEMRNI